MTSASRLASASRSRSAAVGVSTTVTPAGAGDCEVRGEQRHLGPAPPRFLGHGHAHAARRAVADVAHGVERLARASRGDEHALARERARAALPAAQELLGASVDLLGLRHPPHALLALGELTFRRPDEGHASGAQQLHVRLGRRVRPHARVHRRRHEHRPRVRQRSLGQDVVGEPVRQSRERVRRQRRDHEQIGPLEMRIGIRASAASVRVRRTSRL